MDGWMDGASITPCPLFRSYFYEHHGAPRSGAPVFFGQLSFEEGRKAFELLQVERVPHIFVLQAEKVYRGGQFLEISK